MTNKVFPKCLITGREGECISALSFMRQHHLGQQSIALQTAISAIESFDDGDTGTPVQGEKGTPNQKVLFMLL